MRCVADTHAVRTYLPLADLETMASAKSLLGRLCRDEFEFSDAQLRELRRFWRGLKAQIEKSEKNRPQQFTRR